MKRRIISLIMILAMLASLAACGSGTTAATAADELEATTEVQEEVAVEEELIASPYLEDGKAYLYGLGGKEFDLEAAYTNFQMALEDGDTDANFYLGVLCDWYACPEKNYVDARGYYASCGENPNAEIALGLLYLYGDGGSQDVDYAAELFNKALEQGSIDANYGLGSLARYETNYEAAMQYYTAALDGSEQLYVSNAMFKIGSLYDFGQGVEENFDTAMEWYEKAVDLECVDAVSGIAGLYFFGEEGKKDYTKAYEWYEKAASLGDANSLYMTGIMCSNGWGVNQDDAKGMELIKEAAAAGDAAAISSLADLYYYGDTAGSGIEKDYEKALELYEKAAAQGLYWAMFRLGEMYYNGYGVEQDYAKALEWYQKSADAGYEQAETMVEEVKALIG